MKFRRKLIHKIVDFPKDKPLWRQGENTLMVLRMNRFFNNRSGIGKTKY
jgi:hypothetical protein